MKKITMNFFIIAGLLAAVLSVSGCNTAVREEFGTVVIGLDAGSSARAIGENGLPVLKDSAMTIRVTKAADGSEITKEEFDEDDTKSLSLTLPVGETIKIDVIVGNLSAQWIGEAEHTVKSGTNSVSVKISKKAAILNNIFFSVLFNEQHSTSSYKIKMADTEIEAPGVSDNPAFCRDNKGRIYIAYREPDAFVFKRYNSEGVPDMDIVPPYSSPEFTPSKVFLASDLAAGTNYIAAHRKLYAASEDNQFKEVGGLEMQEGAFTVSDNKLVFAHGAGSSQKLKVYNIIKSESGYTADSVTERVIWRDIDFEFDEPTGANVTDILLHGDYVYLIFETHAINHPGRDGKFYTVGGLVRYNIEKTANGWSIKDPESFGFTKSSQFDGKLVNDSYYDNNFYGPVKFIGFDREYLYIADDGLSFKTIATNPVVKANHDRIAKFRFADGEPSGERLTFKNAPDGITWALNKKVEGTEGSVGVNVGWED